MLPALAIARQSLDASQARVAALSYVSEAFAEAVLDGVSVETFAEVALAAAYRELVAVIGEERAAAVAAGHASRIRDGEFSAHVRQ